MKKIYHPICGLFLILFLGGCLQSASLLDHPLDGKNVAVVSDIPDAPFADFDMTIFDRVGHDVPIANRSPEGRSLPPSLVIGNQPINEEAPGPPISPVHRMIDSVLVNFDMAAGIVKGTHQRGASLLRYEETDTVEDADYVLEVKVDDYGIGSDAWQSTAYFEVMGKVKLIDNASGKQVWEEEVMDIVPLSKALLSVGIPGKEMETPAALAKVSYDEMQDVLAGLARYASIQLTAPLRDAYNKNKDRESATFESNYTALP